MSQLELIPTELLPDNYRVPDDPTGRSTGERVQRDRPGLYAAIVVALGEGMGIRQTARALAVHTDTVSAIRDRESHRVGTLKQVTARNLRRFAAVASERLLEEVDTFSPLQLAIATGIAIDKSQLLDGGPTTIVEHQDRAKRIEDLDTVVAELEEAPAIGLNGGAAGQKAIEMSAPRLGAAGSDSALSGGANAPIVDVESVAREL